MAKKLASLVGVLVAFLPDKGNRNPDGVTESFGKVVAENEDGTFDVKVNNPNDSLGPYVQHGVVEGDTPGSFRVVSEKGLTPKQKKLHNV